MLVVVSHIVSHIWPLPTDQGKTVRWACLPPRGPKAWLSHLLRLVKFSPCQSGSQIALEGFRLLWKVSDCFGRFLNFVILSCDPACHAEVTDESESDGDDSSSPSTWHVFKLTSFTISS